MQITSSSQFESLFREHYAALVGYANKLVRERDVAEDIVQQLFTGIWEKRESIEIDGNVRSYLLRSAHNTCLNHIKHQKIKQNHSDHTLATESISHERDALEEEEFSQRIKESIKDLPPQCRKIFLMSRLQGKKYQQIADELQLSIKTIENQMGKALKSLRESLQEDYSEKLRIIKTILWLSIGVSLFSIVMDKG
ncbi:MAG: RNA polymerase sigma-70 factor [Flavobacteriales bacterium]